MNTQCLLCSAQANTTSTPHCPLCPICEEDIIALQQGAIIPNNTHTYTHTTSSTPQFTETYIPPTVEAQSYSPISASHVYTPTYSPVSASSSIHSINSPTYSPTPQKQCTNNTKPSFYSHTSPYAIPPPSQQVTSNVPPPQVTAHVLSTPSSIHHIIANTPSVNTSSFTSPSVSHGPAHSPVLSPTHLLSPSHAPSHAPSYAPSQSPSRGPSYAPTYSPIAKSNITTSNDKPYITIPQIIIFVIVLVALIIAVIYLYRRYRLTKYMSNTIPPITPTSSYQTQGGNKKWKSKGGCGCSAAVQGF